MPRPGRHALKNALTPALTIRPAVRLPAGRDPSSSRSRPPGIGMPKHHQPGPARDPGGRAARRPLRIITCGGYPLRPQPKVRARMAILNEAERIAGLRCAHQPGALARRFRRHRLAVGQPSFSWSSQWPCSPRSRRTPNQLSDLINTGPRPPPGLVPTCQGPVESRTSGSTLIAFTDRRPARSPCPGPARGGRTDTDHAPDRRRLRLPPLVVAPAIVNPGQQHVQPRPRHRAGLHPEPHPPHPGPGAGRPQEITSRPGRRALRAHRHPPRAA
jgi:hypothetical protein